MVVTSVMIKEKLDNAFAYEPALVLLSLSKFHGAVPYWFSKSLSLAITSNALRTDGSKS